MPKYSFNNGVLSNEKKESVATISTPADLEDAQKIDAALKPTKTTIEAMTLMEDNAYLKEFKKKAEEVNGEYVDGLTELFAKDQIPIGLLDKFLKLRHYHLRFIMDDSGSMAPVPGSEESRFKEEETELCNMMKYLAYIPTKMTVVFMNRANIIDLDPRKFKTPQDFEKDAHKKIREAFGLKLPTPKDSTPLYKKMEEALYSSKEPTVHYVFTDGEPSDCGFASTKEERYKLIMKKMKKLIGERPNPEKNPINFISCTDDTAEAQWMKDIEKAKHGEKDSKEEQEDQAYKIDFVSEVDDFVTEQKEIIDHQGPGIDYGVGLHRMRAMLGALPGNENDLDRMDDDKPLDKNAMDLIHGVILSNETYLDYLSKHPLAKDYNSSQLAALGAKFKIVQPSMFNQQPSAPVTQVTQGVSTLSLSQG